MSMQIEYQYYQSMERHHHKHQYRYYDHLCGNIENQFLYCNR